MIRCILIDDEPLALELLKSHVEKTEGICVVASYSDPIKALQEVDVLKPDLIFCDIQMPELTGIQFSKIIGDKFPIVFTTAYDQYAIEGYELNVIDYLLKPISLERFQKAVDKTVLKNNSIETNIDQDYIFVKSEYKTIKVDLQDIHYIKGMADYVTLILKDKKIHTLENLKHYEKTLPSKRFMRIHKSYIISIDKIEFIERARVVLLGDYIPVSDTYKKAFLKRIE